MAEEQPASAAQARRFRLSIKLGLLITSLLVLTIALVSVSLLRGEQQSLTTEMTQRGLTIARDLANSAKNPILANDELTLGLLVQDTLKDPDIAYVIFADPAGKVLAHMDPELMGKPILRPGGLPPAAADLRVQSYTDAKKQRLIDFAVPLSFSSVDIGVLYLGFSQKAIDEALVRARNQTLWVSAVMILVGIAGAIGMSSVLSRPILRLAEGTRAIAAGNFQVTLPVASRDEIGVLTESFNGMARSLREKEMIKRAFSRYVAREVVSEILKDPEHPGLREERRDVTVLFCDMRGFTPLAERLSPEEVVLLLNEFYTLMIDTTFKHDGTLDKFLGDAVMAVFGAPILHPDHSIRAIRTALAMQAGVAELNGNRLRKGKEPIAVGIGVSAGEAVTGTVGTEERMEYAVIGESVNLAARLQSRAASGQILISERTYRNVEDLVTVRAVEPLVEKGHEAPAGVYEVLGLA
ncbi:MAG: adenylate/guanylate cyclase domain-containing protein [Candidatus Rokuibacteriota bacterium]